MTMKGVTGEKLDVEERKWTLYEQKPVLNTAQAYILYRFTVFMLVFISKKKMKSWCEASMKQSLH